MARLDATIGVVEADLLKNIKQMESVSYIYVVNKSKTLKGVISIKELFRQPKSKLIAAVMNKKLVVAHPSTAREKVAYLALKNNIKSVPIVDQTGKFLGAILNDDILRIIYEEVHEDSAHLAGVENFSAKIDNINALPLATALKHRLPWLLVGILGGLLAAEIIGRFEAVLDEYIILAAFIPLIVYIASAVSTQAGFFIIRDLAMNKKINFWSYAWRQFKVIGLMGLLIGAAIFGLIFWWQGSWVLAAVLAVSVFLTILSAIVTGIFLPYVFSRWRFDPANATGPIATIAQDIFNVIIYLAVAQLLL